MRYKYLVTYQYPTPQGLAVATKAIFSKRKAKYCMKEFVEFINKDSGNTPNIIMIYPLGVRA